MRGDFETKCADILAGTTIVSLCSATRALNGNIQTSCLSGMSADGNMHYLYNRLHECFCYRNEPIPHSFNFENSPFLFALKETSKKVFRSYYVGHALDVESEELISTQKSCVVINVIQNNQKIVFYCYKDK